jgi:TIR domain/Transglycosylase associated protein
VGGYLPHLLGLDSPDSGLIWTLIGATIGAIILLAIYVSKQQRRTQQRSEEQLRPRQSEEQRERTGEEVGREYEHAARGQRFVEEAERGLRERQTKGIFISYRRDESAGYAGRIADTFDEHFGEDRVFRDIDSIEPGLDFAEAIEHAVDHSEVLIVVIGRDWLTATDATGQRRLENPDDYVRLEIANALRHNIRVIPLLVQGASMPSADELPDELAPLTRRNAFELHDASWKEEVDHLITTLDKVLGRRRKGLRHRLVGESPPRNSFVKRVVRRVVELVRRIGLIRGIVLLALLAILSILAWFFIILPILVYG